MPPLIPDPHPQPRKFSGPQKGPAERGHVKKRQKCEDKFQHFRQFWQGKKVKNRQKVSRRIFDNFRAAPIFRHLLNCGAPKNVPNFAFLSDFRGKYRDKADNPQNLVNLLFLRKPTTQKMDVVNFGGGGGRGGWGPNLAVSMKVQNQKNSRRL